MGKPPEQLVAGLLVNIIPDRFEFDFGAFYEYVEIVGKLAKAERDACLAAWSRQQTADSECPAIKPGLATAS